MKGTLVVRKSPLGWVIFGSNVEDVMLQIKQVSLIHLSQSVEKMEFSTTEAMGVSIRPCTYEDAKLSAQEREELKIYGRFLPVTRIQVDDEIPLEKKSS